MRIREVGPNLIQLTQMGAFNCYLVREDDGFTLIDTGLPGGAPHMLKASAQSGGSIQRIVLTHPHMDHVGSLDALRAALPDVNVITSARSARLLAGDHTLDSDEPQSPLRGGWPAVTTRATRMLNDGERIGSLQLIMTPGHTPGHAAFLDTRDGTLIAGDAFSTQFGIRVAGDLNWLFPFPAMATWHRETALKSAQRALGLRPERLAVGHGPVLDNPIAAMEQAIRAAARRWRIEQHA